MGVATSVLLVNQAFDRLSQKRIASFSEASTHAAKINNVYDPMRRALLSEHPWPFATRVEALGRVIDSSQNIEGVTQANPAVVTETAHGFTTGDIVSLSGIVGMTNLNGRIFTITVLTADTFELDDEDSTGYDAWVSGGVVGVVSAVEDKYDFTNSFVLPSDYLRPVAINEEEVDTLDPLIEYEIISNGTVKYLYSDADPVDLKYIWDCSDTTLFDDVFVELFTLKLCAHLAYSITRSKTIAEGYETKYARYLSKAKALSGGERRRPRRIRQDDIFLARG